MAMSNRRRIMFDKIDLEQLLARGTDPGARVLSVYLCVDQSHASHLNRGFETALRNMLRDTEADLPDEQERQAFQQCAKQVTDLVSQMKPEGRMLVLFAGPGQGIFWQKTLAVVLENEV